MVGVLPKRDGSWIFHSIIKNEEGQGHQHTTHPYVAVFPQSVPMSTSLERHWPRAVLVPVVDPTFLPGNHVDVGVFSPCSSASPIFFRCSSDLSRHVLLKSDIPRSKNICTQFPVVNPKASHLGQCSICLETIKRREMFSSCSWL